MGREIEHKFLLVSEAWRSEVVKSVRFKQGYFAGVSGVTPTVRIRIAGNEAFLTIKGKPVNLSRSEFEYEIPVADAEAMFKEFCGTRVIDKIRHYVPAGNGLMWEIDEYFGANAPLFTAELEVPDIDVVFDRPAWLGKEVSDDSRYSNGSLSRRPYGKWGLEQ